ncbi:hypothetical protein, unknown function [Leishmania mexicana MHOM/GT/2001/U1103]|uniref:Uncharacterized protein n=1 Tax=Leishmania mexicana (strain MHOM/GT/2001/U1103) TaxID=929439 RepID=E9APD2_LEIMU|nr:hypothetical protein, unknown function [Leishmania mexicana MHOM/GT/2001/U1103]CBZ24796.1 hypothetical protein, unknown function [Leishmania mexicana MHOM/GT/2001/U1103]
MRRFWVPFLTTELRDKWYIDAVMLSILGRDRWQSWGQPKEATCVALSREEVMQLNQKRRECYGRLRECLTELSGALMEKGDHRGTKGNRETLLADSYCHEVAVAGVSAVESDGISCNRKDGRSLSRASNAKPHQLCVPGTTTTTTQRHEPLSVLLTRLQTTASTSFDCFHLIAARVPVAIVSSLSSQYFSSSTPVVYEQVAYQETKVGDLDALSFFVSIESRRQLLNGRVPAGMNRNATADVNGHINVDPGDFAPFTREDQADAIQTAQQLYSAVRHAGLVVTTACSSMVLTVLVHLADVLRERQVFRDNKARAAQLGVTLEQLIGRKTASVHTYSDTAVEKLEKLKRDVVTGEMSLMVLTKELVARFLSENRAKMEKLRDCNPDLFAYLEMAATPEEKNDFDVTRLLSGIALKLMFLTGGGQRSIVADDRRVQADVNRMTDDVALSAMLEVPILNLICWIGCMMGVPITSSHGLLPPQHHGKPLTFMEMDECCGAMRVLFQAVGALPCGNACPQTIREWFPLFPFYAVNSEGKRVLVYLYTAQVTAIQRVPLKLQKDMTLPSFTAALKRVTGRGLADICNYFFEPNFTVGHSPCNSDSSSDTASVDATQRSASAGEPLLPSMSGSSASWSKSTAFMHRTSPSLSPLPTTADGKSCRDERRSSSASSDASSSCSTLMEENLNIDVYTYTNPQMQLYLRCSDEATMRPHRVTELTPSVHTTFYCSTRDIEADRPDIAPALRHAVPKLLPSQGLLMLRWTSGEPLVTFCAGDLVCVMAERVATSVAGGGDATRMSSSSQQQQQQSRTSRAHDFTGAISRVSEGNGTSEALIGGKEGATGAADNNSGNAAAARARTHLAIVDGPEKHSSDTVSSLHSHVGAHNTALEDDSMIMSSSSCAVAETARAYQGVMHDVLGLHEKVSRRIGVQWRVLEVLPCSPLARQSWRMSRANSLSAVAAAAEKQDESDRHNAYYREVVLHVTAPDMPFAVPLRILTIGHERASVSAFTFVNPNDDTVCWSNQNLIASVLNGDGNQDGGKSSHPGPNGLLCDTEEALHSIYYSIGVLLGNAITNGVHFTAPIAPLAFLLMKRAVMSGDYSSKNLMWLEPADGNLLSPTLLLNSAYEILNMTDHQYVAFLHMRSLDNPDSHIFPVTHSLADEIREDKASLLQQQSRDTPNASIPLDHPLSTPRTPTSVLGYLTSIQAYNRTGSAFHRSSSDMSNYSGDSGSCVHSFLRGAHVPVQDAIQEYRDQQQIKGKKSRAPPLVLNSHSNDQLHARLPSRREYISLYLANDLAWSPVRRDGHGAKNKELWVNMARGFMASSLAKSPLMTHCCSRVIREVLCVPRKVN